MRREPDISRQIPLLADPGATRGAYCPDDALLAEYADARAGSDQLPEIETHLADCSFCLGQVGFLVRDAGQELPAVPGHLLDAVREPKDRWHTWVRSPLVTPLAAAATLIVAAAVVFQLDRLSDFATSFRSTSDPVQSTSPAPSDRTVRNGPTTAATLRILEPVEGAELAGPEIDLRWEHVPQALQYTLVLVNLQGDLVWEGRSTTDHVSIPTADLVGSRRYFLWVEAQLRGGGAIKSTPVGFRMAPG